MQRLADGRSVATATVIESKGSVPGKPGARLAVASDGTRRGTVGGAGLEQRVEAALEALLASAADGGARAGGEVETFTLHRDAKSDDSNTLDSLCGGKVTVAMEVLTPMPHILLVGGGHCSRAIADHASLLGWRWSVLDPRPEYAAEARWPAASERHCMTAEAFLSESQDGLHRFSDILLVGHDWSFDQTVLIGLLKRLDAGHTATGRRPADDDSEVISQRPRIGVIGSRAKWRAFEAAAGDAGVGEQALESVACPIGLDIGAESPNEIAVAVCADIIRREQNG